MINSYEKKIREILLVFILYIKPPVNIYFGSHAQIVAIVRKIMQYMKMNSIYLGYLTNYEQ